MFIKKYYEKNILRFLYPGTQGMKIEIFLSASQYLRFDREICFQGRGVNK